MSEPEKVVLYIGGYSSQCGACGGDADPYEKQHTALIGYRPKPGCGATYTHVAQTTFRGDGIDHAARMRPDLISLSARLQEAGDLMSRGHEMAYALQEASHRLFTYDPTQFKHCGAPLTELGRCDHRDYHATPFAPQVGSDGRSVDFPDMAEAEPVTEEDKEYYG